MKIFGCTFNLLVARKVSFYFFNLYLFILLYNIVLVLPYIDLNLPWVYMLKVSFFFFPIIFGKYLFNKKFSVFFWSSLYHIDCRYNFYIKKESEVAQSCAPLCYPVEYSPPGSSVHGILQARILEWVAISFSRGSSQSRDQTQVSCIAGRFFNLRVTREAPSILSSF